MEQVRATVLNNGNYLSSPNLISPDGQSLDHNLLKIIEVLKVAIRKYGKILYDVMNNYVIYVQSLGMLVKELIWI